MAITRILLDTSAYAGFKRGHQGIGRAVQAAEEIWLSAIVLGELRAGFAAGQHRRRNEDDLARFLESPRVGVLTIDADTSLRYALLVHALKTAGTPIPTNDVWIGANAMQHGLCIVTTDTHFRNLSQVLVDIHEVIS